MFSTKLVGFEKCSFKLNSSDIVKIKPDLSEHRKNKNLYSNLHIRQVRWQTECYNEIHNRIKRPPMLSKERERFLDKKNKGNYVQRTLVLSHLNEHTPFFPKLSNERFLCRANWKLEQNGVFKN